MAAPIQMNWSICVEWKHPSRCRMGTPTKSDCRMGASLNSKMSTHNAGWEHPSSWVVSHPGNTRQTRLTPIMGAPIKWVGFNFHRSTHQTGLTPILGAPIEFRMGATLVTDNGTNTAPITAPTNNSPIGSYPCGRSVLKSAAAEPNSSARVALVVPFAFVASGSTFSTLKLYGSQISGTFQSAHPLSPMSKSSSYAKPLKSSSISGSLWSSKVTLSLAKMAQRKVFIIPQNRPSKSPKIRPHSNAPADNALVW